MGTTEPGWFWKNLNDTQSFDLLADKVKQMHIFNSKNGN